jgi:carboxyl-terminal processing protease
MEKRTAPFRVVVAALVFGVAFGSAATLVTLRAAGVRLQAGLNTPAFQKFFGAYDDLHNHYYQTESQQKLLNGAVAGMTKSIGDPFTDYFPPTDAKQFEAMLSGSFDGIGVTIQSVHQQVVIVSVNKGSPAEAAGLKPKDVIMKVNGTSVVGDSLQKVSQMVTGPRGSKVILSIQRPSVSDKLFDVTVTRAKITKQSVFSKMLSKNVGYLQISVVADNTAQEVANNLQSLKKQGATSLILDLRGNPGGYLQQAVKITGDFIPKGKVVVETQGRNQQTTKLSSPGPGSHWPMVVMMDENTASAAEILASALHDDIHTPLVGTKSFGKGTVQVTQSYSDGSTLKYTVAKWLTPTGAWINKKGIQPTVQVALPAYASLPGLSQDALPLKLNDNNSTVAVLQKTLKALGYAVDRTDGYFDASTEQAVASLQTKHGLPATGVVDAAAASALQADFSTLLSKSDTQLQKAEQVLGQITHAKQS